MRTPLVAIAALLASITLHAADEAKAESAKLALHADQPGPVISRHIYGQFAEHLGRCIYGGLWVGEDSDIPNTRGIRNDMIEALRKLKVPVLRWPGGCFADEYHWKDGIGPREKRPSMINTHWGGVVENNHFGTHEFFDLVELVGCEAYVCGNVGSGSVQEMMEWVEYMTSDADSPMANLRRANGRDEPWKMQFFAVGNESWGCGGNMRPEYYSDLYRRYNTFVKNYGRDYKIYRVAGGSNADDYHWTETVMDRVGPGLMDGLSLHYYSLPTGDWSAKGSSTDFAEDQWFSTLRNTMKMDEFVMGHSAIMDKYDPEKKVGLVVDEWGTWYDPLPDTHEGFLEQQNTLRDAIVAGLNFNIFHQHADRISMANIAQMVNVLQAMALTKDDQMILTPTYHAFEMYSVHQDATFLPMDVETPDYSFGEESIPMLSTTASRDTSGKVHVSLINSDPDRGIRVSCSLEGIDASSVRGRILTADTMTAKNDFDNPTVVAPQRFEGASIKDDVLYLELPSKCLVTLAID